MTTATATVTKRADQLQQGDVVLCHGMRVLLDRPVERVERDRPVFSSRGLVLNRDDVSTAGVPMAYTADPSGEHRWTIQGADFTRWMVEAR